jgi:selenide,water dikinase
MLTGHFAGDYELDALTVDLRALAARARAELVLSPAIRVDARARQLHCANGEVLSYDVLSLAPGSLTRVGSAKGVEAFAVSVRPLERLVKAFNAILVLGREGQMAVVTIVGGGAASVELALCMERRFRRELFEVATHVRVIADTPILMPELSAGARHRLVQCMRKRNVEAQVGSAVVEVGDGFVKLANGLEFATDAVIWATGAAAPPWIRDAGLACDEHGFMLVNEMLQSPSHPEIFGAGDCVNVLGHAYPKAGVFAVRAAPVLAANLRAAMAGGALQAFTTKRDYLALIATGDRRAVGNLGRWGFGGRWVWWWKDRIDRRFIARYSDPIAR